MSIEHALVGFLALYILVAGMWLRHSEQKATRQMVRDFVRLFPGRCMICSYHAWGIREGFVRPPVPVEPHDCIERSPSQ